MYAKWIEVDKSFSFSDSDNGGVKIDKAYYVQLLTQNSKGLGVIGRNAEGLPVLIDIAITLDGLCAAIDSAADAARQSVAGDPLRAVEYEKAAQEAQAFKLAGYPADAVPRGVSAWAINGRTPKVSADSILVEAAAYTEALYCLRETRLAAKEQVRALWTAGSVDQAKAVSDGAVAMIKTMVQGVGNAAKPSTETTETTEV